MNLLSRLKGRRGAEQRYTLEDYAGWLNSFVYNGLWYPSGLQQTLVPSGREDEAATERTSDGFQYVAASAYATNGVVFACMLVRQLVFSSVRFQWQRLRNGKPSDTYGTRDLRLLERPWPNASTQDLLSRMIQDADLAGNSYWVVNTSLARLGTQEPGGELVRLRPDWVEIIARPRRMNTGASAANRLPRYQTRLDSRGGQVGWEKLGYAYTEGGPGVSEPAVFTVDEVAHFAPIPDPMAVFTGMSWLTPILREIQADKEMTRHQRKFFENGATPNMVIKHFPGAPGVQGATIDAIKRFAKELDKESAGTDNAYKTLHLYPGAEATVVGANLRDIDFKNVRGGGETRIAAAAGVPPVIVGLSEGLEAATYSNYSQARRRFADGTMHPLWENAAGTLEDVLDVPDDASRLWYDASGVPFLREDEKDAAEIARIKAETINSYVTAGYKPDSVIAAVEADDPRLLVHSGLYSVQLQRPGSDQQGFNNNNDDDQGADSADSSASAGRGRCCDCNRLILRTDVFAEGEGLLWCSRCQPEAIQTEEVCK